MEKKKIIALLSCAGVVMVLIALYAGFRVMKPSSNSSGISSQSAPGSDAVVGTPGTSGKTGALPPGGSDSSGMMDNPEKQYVSRFGPLPRMMMGTRVDGGLMADKDGRLIVLPDIKRRFEYFLTGVSEEGLEKCTGRIRENIAESLPSNAAEEASRILDSYLKYKDDLRNVYNETVQLPQNTSQVDELKTMVVKRKSLRRKHLSPEVVDAFFGDDEIYDDFSLKRMALFYDKSLTDAEKEKALKKLEDQLPEDMRERKKREREVAKTMEKYKGR